jgi:hypothetical protein
MGQYVEDGYHDAGFIEGDSDNTTGFKKVEICKVYIAETSYVKEHEAIAKTIQILHDNNKYIAEVIDLRSGKFFLVSRYGKVLEISTQLETEVFEAIEQLENQVLEISTQLETEVLDIGGQL